MRIRPHLQLGTVAALLVLSVSLIGCGASTDKETAPAPPPPPPGVISLDFLNSPEANVFNQGSSNNLAVQASKDGANADSNTVTFFADRGTLSPVSTLPRNGIASTILSLPTTTTVGALTISASATATNTVVEPFEAYVRPTPDLLQVLVPAYFSASDAAAWDALTTGAQSYPDVQINVIVKPDNAANGVIPAGTYTADPALVTAIGKLKTAHPLTKVLAYVATGGGINGAISLADVQTTLNQYAAGYGTNIDGYYLDGMAVDQRLAASFYQPITTQIATISGLARNPPMVVGNPATYPHKDYAGLVDVLVTYNGPATGYQIADPQAAGATWVYERKNTAQAMLVHTASTCSDMQDAVAYANKPRMNTGWIFVTDRTIGAPWSTLPAVTYWKSFLGTVDAINKGNRLPAC